ncbi:hypothetical protein [Aeromicrobium duanguangcaii]|uniref:MFS transporter n=1 Tax=Aeromicrobium duanguangcaii TaxID=2968086 RepID=A0ABY5KFU8_9ACTN|nr:hypothetical protein [Aeromicrobium duanguangcaii]MCD9153565.1 hypothetical protein [Aeromicrobium duanguangcaii]UUI69349.1 hypothetical protein NP095_04400 [Aeromicrobium duanguangcaii]
MTSSPMPTARGRWLVGVAIVLLALNLRVAVASLGVVLPELRQDLGYLVAGLGPFGVGALHDATGSWTAPLVALIASSAVIAAAGVVVSRPRMLEDTLR